MSVSLERTGGLDLDNPRCEALFRIATLANRHFILGRKAKVEWWRATSGRYRRKTDELDRQMEFHEEMFDEVNQLADFVPALGFAALEDFRAFAAKSQKYSPKVLPAKAERAIRRMADQYGAIQVRSGRSVPEPKKAKLLHGQFINLDTLDRLCHPRDNRLIPGGNKTKAFIKDFLDNRRTEVLLPSPS